MHIILCGDWVLGQVETPGSPSLGDQKWAPPRGGPWKRALHG